MHIHDATLKNTKNIPFFFCIFSLGLGGELFWIIVRKFKILKAILTIYYYYLPWFNILKACFVPSLCLKF
jgi:hypothetical protein